MKELEMEVPGESPLGIALAQNQTGEPHRFLAALREQGVEIYESLSFWARRTKPGSEVYAHSITLRTGATVLLTLAEAEGTACLKEQLEALLPPLLELDFTGEWKGQHRALTWYRLDGAEGLRTGSLKHTTLAAQAVETVHHTLCHSAHVGHRWEQGYWFTSRHEGITVNDLLMVMMQRGFSRVESLDRAGLEAEIALLALAGK